VVIGVDAGEAVVEPTVPLMARPSALSEPSIVKWDKNTPCQRCETRLGHPISGHRQVEKVSVTPGEKMHFLRPVLLYTYSEVVRDCKAVTTPY
jgi:hypothetical protein